MTGNLIDEYKAQVSALYPAVGRDVFEKHSISEANSLALERLAGRLGEKVAVLEVGTFLGVSTFHWATQPNICRVVSVDVNPTLSEISSWGVELSGEPPVGTRLHDVVSSALKSFPEAARKITLVEGTVKSLGDPEVFVGEGAFLAFIDGAHQKEAVQVDLGVVFGGRPDAIAVLHDVMWEDGPDVLAGIAAFTREDAERPTYKLNYQLKVLSGVRPGDAPLLNLGVLYPKAAAAELEKAAGDLFADPTPLLFKAMVKLWRRRAERTRRKEARARK